MSTGQTDGLNTQDRSTAGTVTARESLASRFLRLAC